MANFDSQMELDGASQSDLNVPEPVKFSGPLTERLAHKDFKARKGAYEELQHIYASDENLSEDYSSFFKKMCTEANVIAQEAAVDCFLVYFDKCPAASKDIPTVLPSVVDKFLGANKTSLAKKAQDLLQLMIEIDTPEAVIQEIMKAYKHKTPKVRLAAVQCAVEAVRNFGPKVPLRDMLKKDTLLSLFSDTDGKVRKEAQNLTVEIYRYVKDAMKNMPFFGELRDTQKADLEKAFSEVQSEPPPQPARRLRSDIAAPSQAGAELKSGAKSTAETFDDLVPATPVLSKLPKNFFEVVGGNGKWTERKDLLENLATLTSGKKLQPDDYLELVKLLKRLLNDSNIPLVALAIKIFGGFAAGLESGFASYTRFYFATLLDKYKEKKVTVLEPLNATMELLHIHSCISLPDFAEDIIAGITNKVPQVRESTLQWLSRCLNRSEKPAFQKAYKPLCATVAKACDDSCGPVRDAALKILASAQLTLGEAAVAAYIPKLDKKLQDKFRNFVSDTPGDCGMSATSSASTQGPGPLTRATPKPPRKGETVPLKRTHGSPSPSQGSSEDGAPPLKRVVSTSGLAMTNKARRAIPTPRDVVAKAGKAPAKAEEDYTLTSMTDAQVEESIQEFVAESTLKALQSSSFKDRADAMDKLSQAVGAMDDTALERHCELWIRFLKARPGWKEANFQVLNKVLALIEAIAKRAKGFSKRCVWLCLSLIVDKITDNKQRNPCRSCLMQFCENVGPRFVFDQLMKATGDSKMPKTVSEVLEWMAEAVEEYGCNAIDLKALVAYVKDAFEKQNPAIKNAGIKTLVSLRRAHGPRLRDLLEGVKPQLLATIDEQFARVQDGTFQPRRRAPDEGPTRGSSGGSSAAGGGGHPRTDISGQLTPALLADIAHADWKKRQTALAQVEKVVEGAHRRITPNVGPALAACKARLADSNKNITVQALGVISVLAQSMGPPMKGHVKLVADGVFHCLSENKPNVRQAAAAALTAIEGETGLEPLLPFLPKAFDMLAARADLTQWLAATLAKGTPLPAACLQPIVKPIIACLQDRAPEVRKSSEAILGPLLRNVGNDAVARETRDLKPAVAKTIAGYLDRQRGSAPPAVSDPVRLVEEEKENDSSRVNLVTPALMAAAIPTGIEKVLKARVENSPVNIIPDDAALVPPTLPTQLARRTSPPLTLQPPAPLMADQPMEIPLAADFLTPHSIPGPLPAEPEAPTRMDLQLDATFAPSSLLRSISCQPQAAPVRINIPMTDAKQVPVLSRTQSGQMQPLGSSRGERLAELLEQVHAGDNVHCIEAVKKLLENFINQGESDGYDCNQVLQCLLHRASQVFDNEPLNVREGKFLLTALQALFTHPVPAERVSDTLITHTFNVVLGQLLGDRLRKLPSGEYLLKAFNTVILKLLENGSKTRVFSCLLSRLHEAQAAWSRYRSDDNQRMTQLLSKCILKLVSIIIGAPATVDWGLMLRAVDEFFSLNPPTAFRPAEDLPLKTVKTALGEFAKARGPALRLSMPATCHPSTAAYLDHCLQKLGGPAPLMAAPPPVLPRAVPEQVTDTARSAGPSPVPVSPAGSQYFSVTSSKASSMITCAGSVGSVGFTSLASTPRADQDAAARSAASSSSSSPPVSLGIAAQLEDIFVRIRNKEETLKAIQELHTLTSQNPDLDIEPWLAKTSVPFQNYVKRQLHSIQEKKQAQAAPTPALQPSAMTLETLRQRLNQQPHLSAIASAAMPPLAPAAAAAHRDVDAQFESIRQRMQGMFPMRPPSAPSV